MQLQRRYFGGPQATITSLQRELNSQITRAVLSPVCQSSSQAASRRQLHTLHTEAGTLPRPHSHPATVPTAIAASQGRSVPWIPALRMLVAPLLVSHAPPQPRQRRFSTTFSARLTPLRMSPESIGRGELVEVAHCIRIPRDEYQHHLRYSVLEHYLYVGRDGGMLLALGVGSLFNHSQQPNLNYTIDHDQLVIRYRAARAIAANEELTITYGSSSKLWFEDRSVDSLESSRISMVHEYLDDESGFLGGFQLDNGAR